MFRKIYLLYFLPIILSVYFSCMYYKDIFTIKKIDISNISSYNEPSLVFLIHSAEQQGSNIIINGTYVVRGEKIKYFNNTLFLTNENGGGRTHTYFIL